MCAPLDLVHIALRLRSASLERALKKKRFRHDRSVQMVLAKHVYYKYRVFCNAATTAYERSAILLAFNAVDTPRSARYLSRVCGQFVSGPDATLCKSRRDLAQRGAQVLVSRNFRYAFARRFRRRTTLNR